MSFTIVKVAICLIVNQTKKKQIEMYIYRKRENTKKIMIDSMDKNNDD